MPPETSLAKRSLLVVDDDQDVVGLLGELLEGEGYEVASASDGIDALSYLYARRPWAVLIDVCMPRMDGVELIRQMRSERALAGVIVIAMSGGREMLARAKEAGAQATLLKPFDAATILRTVLAETSESCGVRSTRGDSERDAVA